MQTHVLFQAFSYKSNALVVCYQDYVLTIGQGQGPKVTGVKRTKVTCSADGNWRARVKMLNSHYDSFVPLNMVNCRPLECSQPDAISLGKQTPLLKKSVNIVTEKLCQVLAITHFLLGAIQLHINNVSSERVRSRSSEEYEGFALF